MMGRLGGWTSATHQQVQRQLADHPDHLELGKVKVRRSHGIAIKWVPDANAKAMLAYLSLPRTDGLEDGPFLRRMAQVTSILYRWMHQFVGERFEVKASATFIRKLFRNFARSEEEEDKADKTNDDIMKADRHGKEMIEKIYHVQTLDAKVRASRKTFTRAFGEKIAPEATLLGSQSLASAAAGVAVPPSTKSGLTELLDDKSGRRALARAEGARGWCR